MAAYAATAAAAGEGFVVAWQDTRDGHAEIYARLLDAGGNALEPARRLTRSLAAWEPHAAAVDGAVIVGWYENGGGSGTVPKLGAWNLDGSLRWSRTLADAGHHVAVSARGATVAAVWIVDAPSAGAGIWVAWFDADGRPHGDAVRVLDAWPGMNQLRAALDEAGNLWVVFDTRLETPAEEIVLIQVGRGQGTRSLQVTPHDGAASKYPDVAVERGQIAVTWIDERDGNQEIYLAVGSAAAFTLADGGRRITDTSGDSIGPFLAWSGSRLGLAWCDDATGEQEVHLQTFDASGAALAPFQRVTKTPWASLMPAIRPAGHGFLLAWNEWDRDAIEAGHDETRRAQILTAVVR